MIDETTEVVLGEDGHGRWHGLEAGHPIVAGEDVYRFLFDCVVCYPREGWWNAVFTREADGDVEIERPGGTERRALSPREVYVHIGTPGEHHDGAWRFIDLELDVIRRPDGSVEIKDEDEFDVAIERYLIPADVVARARATCAEIEAMLARRTEPFGDVGRAWLERFRAR